MEPWRNPDKSNCLSLLFKRDFLLPRQYRSLSEGALLVVSIAVFALVLHFASAHQTNVNNVTTGTTLRVFKIIKNIKAVHVASTQTVVLNTKRQHNVVYDVEGTVCRLLQTRCRRHSRKLFSAGVLVHFDFSQPHQAAGSLSFQVWTLSDSSWKAPVWIVSSPHSIRFTSLLVSLN